MPMRIQALVLALALTALPLRADEGADLIGRPAPPFAVGGWLNGEPDPAGRALLVRMWTVGCTNCRDSAATLQRLHERYGPRGLLVVGVHHPKSPRALKDPVVRRQAAEWGMTFPIAQDRDWRAVKSWWLTRPRTYTSASILVDHKGIIRHVHPGGSLHPSTEPEHAACDAGYRGLEDAIQRVLAERMVAGR